MAATKVPIVPQWNLTSGCVCTPDGGFLYVGARSINYIGNFNENEIPLVKAFHSRQNIHSLDVDPAWPQEQTKDEGAQPKRFAVLAQDNSVQIWDYDKGCAISGHKAHFNITKYLEGRGLPQHNECLMSYMSNSSVLSISAHDLVVYCVASNSYWRRSSFLPSRGQQWVILRCSPYNEHIFAVGSSRGLVLLCDLQKMQVLYTLRGHDAAITSLSWTMFENVPMKQPVKQDEKPVVVKPTKPELQKQKHSIDTDDIFDIYDYDYLENEFGAPANVDRGQIDDVKVKEDICNEKSVETTTSTNFDFVEACMSLKQDIDALKSEPPLHSNENDDEVTLADCKQVKKAVPSSPSCSNESTEGSLELIEHSSSDDGVDVDGTDRKPKQQILLHQAEVHAIQTLEQNKELPADIAVEKCCMEAKESSVSKEVNSKVVENTIQRNCVLLASASVDCNFWVWNTINGSACDNWTMRGGGHGSTSGNSNFTGKNTHIEIAWLQKTKVITSNKHGELAIWAVKPQINDIKANFKFVEEKRRFTPRNVVAFEIGKNRNANRMWSITSNREVICEDLKTQELVAKYCCASTNINIMRECPDDMNKIALGFSDRRVGILDISKLTSNNVYIENFSQRIDSAVLSIVWSPDNKKLAFGTLEGRVGIINVENTKQQIITYNPISGKPIYSMDWKDNSIFVICNEDLAIYDANAKTKDATVVQDIGKVTAITVRGVFILLGTKAGTVKIYRQSAQPTTTEIETGITQQTNDWSQLTCLQEIAVGSRYISDLAWNPIATQLCAVACNDNKILILEFNEKTGEAVCKRRIRIKNYKAANGFIKWSNRDENLLVTSGFDGGIRVWDLRNEQDEEKFIKHFQCPMFCALFLPTNENIIMCTGKSTSVEFIDMSVEQSATNDASTNTKRFISHALDNVQWATKMILSHENHNNNKSTSTKEKRRQKRILAGVDLEDANQKETVESQPQQTSDNEQTPIQDKKEITEMLQNLKIDTTQKQICNSTNNTNSNKCNGGEHCPAAYLKSSGTLLYLTTKELNKDALEKLRALLTNKNVQKLNKDFLCFKLFGTKADAMEILKTELNNHQHCAEKGISTLFMPQLAANLKDEIVKCIQKRTLNAWHVAMAPSISYTFWQKCCQAYAEQLLEEGYGLQAASFMLALHKQCDAIDMLMQRQYFKEALLLGRIYLQPNDPLLNTIIDKWITHIDLTGNLAGAAMLSALSGQMNRAHDILSKYRNPTPEVENVLKLVKQK